MHTLINFIFFLGCYLLVPSLSFASLEEKVKELEQRIEIIEDHIGVPQTQSLNSPNMNSIDVQTWAAQAAVQTYTYNYVDYQEKLQNLRSKYTAAGYKKFIKDLKASRNVDAVVSKKLVVSAVPTETPSILREGVKNKQYSWQVHVPLLIQFESASERITQKISATLLIVRVPKEQSPEGIAIEELTIRESSR